MSAPDILACGKPPSPGEDISGVSRRPPLARIFSYAAILLSVFYLGTRTSVFMDDVFITLVYARNLAVGDGMVFQAGERVLGTTTPLWCALNALGFLLHDATRTRPESAHWLYLLATFLAASGIERLGWNRGWGIIAGAVGAAYVLLPIHGVIFGAETSLAIWLGCELALAMSTQRHGLASVTGTALILTRPEAGLLLTLAAVVEFARNRSWSRIVRLVVPATLILLPLLLLAQLYYGAPLPNTFAAKRAQLSDPGITWLAGTLPGTLNFLKREATRSYGIWTTLAVVGLLVLCRGFKSAFHPRSYSPAAMALVLLLAWSVTHVLALQLLGTPFYIWYTYPVWLATLLLVGTGLDAVCRGIAAKVLWSRPIIRWAATGCLLFVAWYPWRRDHPDRQKARYEGYRALAEELRQLSPIPGSRVFAQEIGAFRFHAPRSVTVLDGFYLVRPLPADGRLPTPTEQIATEKPEFVLESHPNAPHLTPAQRAYQTQRLQPDFRLLINRGDMPQLVYRPVALRQNLYGIQALLARKD